MGSRGQVGIQQLLNAEQDAQQIVQRAREGRTFPVAFFSKSLQKGLS